MIDLSGPLTLNETREVVARGPYRFGFNLFDKGAIRSSRRREAAAVLAGVLSVLPGDSDALQVADSVYALDESGVVTYTSNLKVSGELSLARVLSVNDLTRATAAVEAALKSPSLERVQRRLEMPPIPSLIVYGDSYLHGRALRF